MSPEITSIIGIGITQVIIFAKVLINDKRKADASQVQNIQSGFKREQDRQDGELNRLRDDLKTLRQKLDDLQERHIECKQNLSAAETRLQLLEEFRDVVAKDSPTGATRRALPPSNGDQK